MSVPASPGESATGRWSRFWLVIKVIEVRLRFIAVLVLAAALVGYWDTIRNHWDKWTRAPRPAPVATTGQEFYCPMHPSVVRPGLKPDGTVPKCPICGMPLSERRKGEANRLPPGVTARVQLTPERVQLAGVRTETIRPRALVRKIVTAGRVSYDEARLSRIVSRVAGYIQELHVNETFTTVSQGQALAEIYSPDLFTALRELVVTQQSGRADLIEPARTRLKLLGVDDTDIDALLKEKSSRPEIAIRSPQRGHVIARSIVRGAHVDAGATLFEIADLSAVWIEADVPEKDLALVRSGLEVEATLEAFPGRTFAGKITLVHPHVDAATRTVTARISMPNPDHQLRPGMFATVRVHVVPGGEVLAVPEPAVIDTGAKKVVYVEREPGVFEGREVRLGPPAEGFYPVLNGLTAGECVASAGAFLVDAETRLNPAAAGTYVGASGGPQAGGAR